MVALPSAHGPAVPGIDPGARKRLAARFGSGVEAWFGELPGVRGCRAGRLAHHSRLRGDRAVSSSSGRAIGGAQNSPYRAPHPVPIEGPATALIGGFARAGATAT